MTAKIYQNLEIYKFVPGQANIPRSGAKVAVIPTHVISPDQVYVQLYSEEFNIFQDRTLQEVKLKPITRPPGIHSYYFNCELLKHK